MIRSEEMKKFVEIVKHFPSESCVYMGGYCITVWNKRNDYGASVICNAVSYGHESGLLELAVVKKDSKGEQHITYDTPITNDVVGFLTAEEAFRLVRQIEALDE